MSEDQVVEEAKVEDAKIEENTSVSLAHLKGTLKQIDVTAPKYDAIFDPKFNIRDPELYADRVTRKVAELRTDQAIRNPLVVCVVKVPGEETTVERAACGFIRRQALCVIKREFPAEFEAYFAKIPVYVIPDCTERDRELVMADHGSEETLNEYEVYLAVARLLKQGVTEEGIASALAKMLLSMCGAKDRQTYVSRLNELVQDGFVMVGTLKCRTVAKIQLQTFRGRIQKYRRILQSPDCVRDAFRRHVLHIDGGVPITYQHAELLAKMTPEEAVESLAQAKQTQKGKSATSKPATERIWGVAKLKRSQENMKSNHYKKLLSAALGDDNAAQEVPDLDDDLFRIEQAMNANPEAFWAMVDEILADLMPIEPDIDTLESEDDEVAV